MKIKIQTTLGDIIIRLYDETPMHRDNFLKLAKEGKHTELTEHSLYSNIQYHIKIESTRLIRTVDKTLPK